jgi:signal transduction histidine kinase
MFSLWSRKANPPPAEPPREAPRAPEPSSHRELGLLSLLELSNELNVRSDVFEIADVGLFNLMGHFGCARGALWLLSDDSAAGAVLVRAQGMPDSVAQGLGALWMRWFATRSAAISEPVLVDELRDLGSVPGLDLAVQAGVALFAPVAVRNRALGLLALGRRVGGGDFGLMEREVLQASLNLVAVAMDNTNLYNRAVENNRRLRRANEQLTDMDRIKSEFLSNMNHELRTPLTIISAYLDMVIAAEQSEQCRDHLRIVKEQTTHLHSMVMNVLDFSSLTRDDLEIRTARGDVKEVLREYFVDRRPGVTAELREFVYSAATDVPPALFDRQRLLQVVDSLVENAVKFTPPGARIHLRVEAERSPEQDRVRVDVEDNGPGIPPDRLPHIFESFRQGDGSGTREHGGMGLGLALAKQLAEKMNGELSVTTEIGAGTVFTLRLPAA